MARKRPSPLTAKDTQAIRAAHRRMHRAFLAGVTRHPKELVQLSSGPYAEVQYWPNDPNAYVWVRGERWRVAGRPTRVGAKLSGRMSGDPKTAMRRKAAPKKTANPAPKAPKRKRAGRPLREGQRVYHCAKRCR